MKTIQSLFVRWSRSIPLKGLHFALGLFALIGAGCHPPAGFNDDGTIIVQCPLDIIVLTTNSFGATVPYPTVSYSYDRFAFQTTNITEEVVFSWDTNVFFPPGSHDVTAWVRVYDESTRKGHVCHFQVIVRFPVDQICTPPASPKPPEGFSVIGTFRADGLANVDAPLSLIEGCDGWFYGISKTVPDPDHAGFGSRTFFRVSKDGSSGSRLFRFSQYPLNNLPNVGLARVRYGNPAQDYFFGTTAGFLSGGTIFRLDSNGSMNVLHFFGGEPDDGSDPVGGLIADEDGFVYGVTRAGGQYDRGVVFRIWADGTGYGVVRSLTQDGDFTPVGTPAFGLEGGLRRLFLPLGDYSSDAARDFGHGRLGVIDRDGGSLESRHYFYGPELFTTDPDPGEQWRYTDIRGGLVLASNGRLYGAHGLPSHFLDADPGNPGYFYEFDTASGSIQTIVAVPVNRTPAYQNLIQGPDGRLYTFLLGQSGGNQSLIAVDALARTLTTVNAFSIGVLNGMDGLYASPGSFAITDPAGALVAASDGAIYGTAPNGPSGGGSGVLFRYVPPVSGPRPASGSAHKGSNVSSQGPPIAARQLAAGLGTLSQHSQITVSPDHSGLNVGRGLALQGDLLLVGVPFSNQSNYLGAVHVFRRGTTNWNLESTLVPPTNDLTRLFGFSVAINQDLAVIGAPGVFGTSLFAGSAYVFRQTGTNWQQEARLAGNAGTPGDEFGTAVAVETNLVLVGAPGYPSDHFGAAFVFQKIDNTWTKQAVLIPPTAAAQDFTGGAVAIRGTNALVASPRSDGRLLTFKPGAAHLFTSSADNWSYHTNLASVRSYTADLFGASVAAGDGFFVVGAPGLNPTDSNDPLGNRRAAYVFINKVEAARLVPAIRVPREMFGASVSVDGLRVTIGAPSAVGTNGVPGDGGASYVFDRRGTNYFQTARLMPSDAQPGDLFGFTVSASSNWVGVSSILHVNTKALLGSAYAFNVPPMSAPFLSLTPTAPKLRLEWTEGFDGFALEYLADLNSTNWLPVTPPPTTNSLDLSPTNALQFFRLRHP